MKRLSIILLITLFVFHLVGQSAYTKTDLNLRTDGSTRSSILGVIPKGEKVTIDYCNSYWCKVQYQEFYKGFVSKKYLTRKTITKTYNYKLTPDKPVVLPKTSVDYYTNSFGETVQRPTYYPAPPEGASALCRDGTYSFSRNRRGTCSHHGGVSKWLSNTTKNYSSSNYRTTVYTSRSSSSVRCSGITQKGYRCKRRTKSSSGYCWQH